MRAFVRAHEELRRAMTSKLYSDEELGELRAMPKRVTNPAARWVDKPGHRQRNFKLFGLPDEAAHFSVYQRHNVLDENDFSCGIAYLPRGGIRLTLARYNGSSHRHGEIAYRPHIHRTTATAIEAGKRPESRADETDRFETLNGALRCLIEDFGLEGITAPAHDQARLLKWP